MSDKSEQSAADIIRDVEAEYDADIYLYSAAIDHQGFGKVVGCYNRKHKNAILILTTNGGLANSAYKIARFFQNQYEEFAICIPGVCKSAGTLLAIGANKLIMGPFSELGPLDVQLYERDEIFSRKSGLLSHSAFEALKHESFSLYEHVLLAIKQRSGDNISFPVASTVAGEMATGMMAPIFEQISPNVLGSDYRDLQVAIHYGQRLSFYSENIDFGAIKFLTENYPSHDFIIDMQEAEKLFSRVEAPQTSLWKLIGTISDLVLSEDESGSVLRLSDLENEPEEEIEDDEAAASPDASGNTEVDDRSAVDSPRARQPRKKRTGGAEGGSANGIDRKAGDPSQPDQHDDPRL